MALVVWSAWLSCTVILLQCARTYRWSNHFTKHFRRTSRNEEWQTGRSDFAITMPLIRSQTTFLILAGKNVDHKETWSCWRERCEVRVDDARLTKTGPESVSGTGAVNGRTWRPEFRCNAGASKILLQLQFPTWPDHWFHQPACLSTIRKPHVPAVPIQLAWNTERQRCQCKPFSIGS